MDTATVLPHIVLNQKRCVSRQFVKLWPCDNTVLQKPGIFVETSLLHIVCQNELVLLLKVVEVFLITQLI